jgi:hypothetical protein
LYVTSGTPTAHTAHQGTYRDRYCRITKNTTAWMAAAVNPDPRDRRTPGDSRKKRYAVVKMSYIYVLAEKGLSKEPMKRVNASH